MDDCREQVEDEVFFHSSSIDVVGEDVTKPATMIACEDDMCRFVDFHKGKEALPFPGKNEVMINRGLAEKLDLSVGDPLTLRTSDMQTLELTVSGIFDNYINNYVIITPETVEEQWGSAPDIKSAYITHREGIDPHAAGAEVLKQSWVSAVNVNADMQARVGGMLKSLDYIVLIVIICAGSLAFIVLYNLTNININERIREIATIKVLGFYPRETSSYVFRENFILTAMGAIAGLVMGRLLHAYVMHQINIDLMCFDVRVTFLSHLISFALTFIFALIVNFVMFFKLEHINMAESLKSIE